MADQTFAVHCGFFDAINSDRTYSADEMNRPYKRVISNGVFATPNGTPSTDLQVTASSGMNIICKKGEGLFGDKWFENPSGIAITVPSNTGTVPRIDSVLVQVDTRTSGRVGNIVHRTGTPASSPVPPAINQVEGVIEYRLANIRVNAGVSSITQSMITDRRGSSDCPWVTSLIYQVDTSTLYDQWQAAYAEYFEEEKALWDAWYAHLTEELDVSMTLDRHVNTVITSEYTWDVNIGLDYDHNTDILEVYINGLRAVEGTQYVVNDGDTSITLANGLQDGQTVTFVVMRSVIGGSDVAAGYVTPEMYGAAGDGVTDDSQAFQEALDSGYAVYADGEYIVNHVVIQKDTKLELSPNTKIIRTETQSTNQSGIFEFRGTEAESSALTADGAEDAQSVTVADGSIFAKDDTVILTCSGSGEVANKKLVSIVTDVSGNVVTLSNPLQWGYAVSDGASLTKINPITVNIIGNGAVIDGGGLAGRGYAFYMSHCINSHIEGIAVENSATGVMRMDFCHNVTIERCTGKNPVSNSEPYGEFLSIAYSTLVTAKKIITEKYR